MPIYEYECLDCGERFSHLWRTIQAAENQPAPSCPSCQSAITRRVVSQVAVLGSLGGLTPAEQQQKRKREERLASITPKEQIDRLRANKKPSSGSKP